MSIPLTDLVRGFFANAQHIQITDSQLYDIQGNFNAGEAGLDYLQHFISSTALHNSLIRYPPPKCHPGTRETILRVINEWIDDQDPGERILWLNGPAGAGKSAIAQTIAEGRANDQLAASFFFLRNDKERGTTDRLFPTLAWQLAKTIPETRSYIESAVKREPLLATKTIDIQFDHLFAKVFNDLLHDNPGFHPEKRLVIIDGVDECAGEQAQRFLLKLIGEPLAPLTIPLRFLICGRPEPHIGEAFTTEFAENVTRSLVLDDGFADVQKYLKDEFSRIFTDRNISPCPSPAEISRLVKKSSGQFIYASTVIKFVDDKDHNPRRQLDIILGLRSPEEPGSPFDALDKLYTQILSQQPNTRLLRDVFVLVIAFGQPKISFICRRLPITEDELRLKLRRIHSLLHVSDDIIETYHRSVYDFFRDKKRAGIYYIHPLRVVLLRLPQIVQALMIKVFTPVLITVAVLLSAMLALPALFLFDYYHVEFQQKVHDDKKRTKPLE